MPAAENKPFGYWDHFNEILYRGDDAGAAAATSAAEGGNTITPLFAQPPSDPAMVQAHQYRVAIDSYWEPELDRLHIAICQAVSLMNVGDNGPARTILREALIAHADAVAER